MFITPAFHRKIVIKKQTNPKIPVMMLTFVSIRASLLIALAP